MINNKLTNLYHYTKHEICISLFTKYYAERVEFYSLNPRHNGIPVINPSFIKQELNEIHRIYKI
jgi:hypothetical protein